MNPRTGKTKRKSGIWQRCEGCNEIKEDVQLRPYKKGGDTLCAICYQNRKEHPGTKGGER